MGNTLKKKKDLTYEEAKILSEDFLWITKIKERNSFRLVAEYLENEGLPLKNT